MGNVRDDQFELEAKVAVADLAEIEARLSSLGGRLVGRWHEIDRFFDFPDKHLKEADSALRLRQRTDLAANTSQWRLTFKGPRQPSRFKNRREIELVLSPDQPGALQALLNALELTEFISYTKLRTSFDYRECTVELDELEGIGKFIEIEGPDETRIDRVLVDLGLESAPTITQSYLAMVIEHRRQNL